MEGDWTPNYLHVAFITITGLGLFQVLPVTVCCMWRVAESVIASTVFHFKQMVALVAWSLVPWAQQFSQHPPPPVLLGEIQGDLCMSQKANYLFQETNSALQQSPLPIPTLEGTPVPATDPWLESMTLTTLQKVNANNVQCVLWILWNIIDSMHLILPSD